MVRGMNELHFSLLNTGSTEHALKTMGIEGQKAELAWDVMSHGQWLDINKINILNDNLVDVEDLTDWFKTFVLADVVNYAWKQQDTAILSYGMTEEECTDLFLPTTLESLLIEW